MDRRWNGMCVVHFLFYWPDCGCDGKSQACDSSFKLSVVHANETKD